MGKEVEVDEMLFWNSGNNSLPIIYKQRICSQVTEPVVQDNEESWQCAVALCLIITQMWLQKQVRFSSNILQNQTV
jgi:hypothetical protein